MLPSSSFTNCWWLPYRGRPWNTLAASDNIRFAIGVFPPITDFDSGFGDFYPIFCIP